MIAIFAITRIIVAMNNKQQKTLAVIYTDPINGNLEWSLIESLLIGVGCRVIEGSGSSVTFEKEGKRAYFHRPHPERQALRYRIRDTREFLRLIGVTP